MSQPKSKTPVAQTIELLEQYGIAKAPEVLEGGSLQEAPGPRRFAFEVATDLVRVVSQLRMETDHLQARFGDIAILSSQDSVSTINIPFGDLGPKFAVVIALLAERSRLIKTLESFGKLVTAEKKTDQK